MFILQTDVSDPFQILCQRSDDFSLSSLSRVNTDLNRVCKDEMKVRKEQKQMYDDMKDKIKIVTKDGYWFIPSPKYDPEPDQNTDRDKVVNVSFGLSQKDEFDFSSIDVLYYYETGRYFTFSTKRNNPRYNPVFPGRPEPLGVLIV